MSNYRLVAVAVFCLALGFVTGFQFGRPTKQPESVESRLADMQAELEQAMEAYDQGRHLDCYTCVANAKAKCGFLRADLAAHDSLIP